MRTNDFQDALGWLEQGDALEIRERIQEMLPDVRGRGRKSTMGKIIF